ncbi:MAG: SurA N-terminal domain-containing protein [Gammaproteobacteria bacterium]|nr:SurA N-terminal domain-containing protein [Gammaproteobacteria bacterium]
MLQSLRDRMSGPMLWVIIGILVLPFAIWGIGAQSFLGGNTDPTLVKVGGAKITQSQFQNSYDRNYAQLVQEQGDNFKPASVDQAKLKQQVLDSLIDGQVLAQYAGKIGFRADDVAVYDYLHVLPGFQVNGQFSDQTYRSALAAQGLSPAAFEAGVRQQLSAEQLRNAVLFSSFVTPKQALANWRLQHQTRSFAYVLFDPQRYLSQLQVSDTQAKRYYQAHLNQFRAPERIKLDYVELAQAQMSKAPAPDQDVLQAIYDAQKATRFTTPEERKAAYILIKFGADPEAAHRKIRQVAAELKQGNGFAELAKRYSDDSLTKNKGGELGWVRKGMIDPDFEQALFALDKPGEVSRPVKTKFGWQLIELQAVRSQQVQPFDDPKVQAALIKTYQDRELAKRFQEDADKLGEVAFENPGSLEAAAKALSLSVQHTGWFTRKGGTGIAANADVVDAAFSSDVASDGDNSKPIRVGEGDLVVIRKADYQPARQQSFDEVKDQVVAALKRQQAQKRARQAAEALLAQLRAGTSLPDAANAANLKAISLDGLQRDAPGLDAKLLHSVFELARPVDGKPSMGLATLGNGRVAVVALSAVNDAAAPVANDTDLQREGSLLRYSLAGAEFDAYRKLMEQRVHVDRESVPATPDIGSQ